MSLRTALTAIAVGALLASGLAAPTAHADGVAPVARVSCATAAQVSAAGGKKVELTKATPTSCEYRQAGSEFPDLLVEVALGTPQEVQQSIADNWPEEYPYSFMPQPVPELGPGAFVWADASPSFYHWSIAPGVVASLFGWGANVATAKLFRPMMEVYTVDGERNVNGRQWRTRCENYSATARCFTDIWGTTIRKSGDRFIRTDGWVFNSLTYRWAPRALWAGNPLGNTNTGWTATDGRQWRTECDTPTTGRGACRSYLQATVVSWTGSGYRQETKWIFNNMVLFS